MFEWLEYEISAIKTPRFHLVEGPANPKLQDAVLGSSFPLPLSYKEFVLKFGNAKLYRNLRNDSYRIGVLASPRQATLDDGTRIYHVGWDDGASVYVKPESGSGELPVFEFEEGSEEKVAETFEEWLMASSTRARKAYGKEKWAEILHGPAPFTPKEQEVVTTRRLIKWKVLGIDSHGNHMFEVRNESHRTLPTLTVRVCSRDGRLNGAVHLKIGHIGPGQTDVLQVDCYKDLVSPEEVEVFALPDPGPEDREYYWELRDI